MPSVSICIPTYNGARYLREAIASVLCQTFDDIEILVVDDCSNDETTSIAHSMLDVDPRARIVRNENNLGLAGNWNRCVELAKGEYIKFLFQDDILDPGCVARLAESMSHTDGFAFCDRRFKVEDGVPDRTRRFFTEEIQTMADYWPQGGTIPPPEFAKLAVRSELTGNIIGEPSSVMFRKRHWEEFGGFSPYLAQLCDWEYWLRIGVNRGANYLREELVTFRVHGGSESASNSERAQVVASGDIAALLGSLRTQSSFAPIWKVRRLRTLFGRLWHVYLIPLSKHRREEYHPAFLKFLTDHQAIDREIERTVHGGATTKAMALIWRTLDRIAILSGTR